MSRRPNPAADRAEQNRQTLKSLVKLEANKSCADCKRNKHPRWASWNLGIFICIRCSGIHRGMGTHISRVKSVDLDSWTDEQLQSVLKWGNARANKYWEAKLAPGHVPSEAKIENFIRTKYESKRWVMEGGIPDPSTLEVDGDDDAPLAVVQQKVKIERSASQRAASASQAAPAAVPKPQPAIDLFGDDLSSAPPRPSTGPPVARAVPPKAEPAPPKQTKAGDSLLGLDFLGGGQSAAPARPSSTGPASTAPSRPDLKQSILSLYASAPKPPPQPQQQHARQDSFGGLTSPGSQSQQSPQQSTLGGLNDAFGGLSFSSQPSQQQPKPSAFSGLDSFSSTKSPPSTTASSMFGGGGSFFDSTPKSTPATNKPQFPKPSSNALGDFSAFSSPAPSAPSKPAATSGMNDLLDLSMPSNPAPALAPSQTITSPPIQSPSINSAFNLSSPAPPTVPNPTPVSAAPAQTSTGFSNMDAWGGNDVWASSAPSQPATSTISHQASSGGWGSQQSTSASGDWGSTASAQITQDDDFGGWSSAAPVQSQTTPHTQASTQPSAAAPKPFAGGDDLFSNVWE